MASGVQWNSMAVAVVAAAMVVVQARELDPAACAARFDVQRDKIIRTEESREMGARYLSELDVGARRECLRLCCETDSCDVFVFEEKSPGSCYLFNCGPPEDFRCKFTAHGNFSSGVLALSRRLAELQDQERLVRHEQELANLRSPTSTTASSTSESRAAPAPFLQSAPSPQPAQRAPPPPPPPLPTGRCSRYQFECRRGGECIAVYNACDGVPQCADGSDEAPELGCPASPAPPAALPAAPLAAPLATSPVVRLPLATSQLPPPQPAPALAQRESMEESVEGMAAAGGVASELWPHRLAQAQLQHRDRYNGGAAGSVGAGGAGGAEGAGSHIFSHKGGLLQDSAFEPPPAAWPRRGWPPQTGMDSMSMSASHAWGPYAPPDWDTEPHRAWPVPPRPEPDISVYTPPKTMPEMPIMYSSQQQTLRDSPKKGFDLMTKSQLTEAATDPPAPVPPARRPSAIDRSEEKPLPIENTTKKKMLKDPPPEEARRTAGAGPGTGAAAMLATDERDGLSERPPAAVLLLVLGSLLTTALGTLLACRARAARRRRRAHPRYALDADYLVNGMYL